jgi:D-alanine-D-alanine ligase
MRVAILHEAIDDQSTSDARDALVQAEAVERALARLGHEGIREPCGLDLERLRQRLLDIRPDVVFNLVESLAGRGSLIHLVPFLLSALGIPFTGAPADALFLTSGKLLAKRALRTAGLPTPAWIESRNVNEGTMSELPEPGTYIVKSCWEHASLGIDDDSVVTLDDPEQARDRFGFALRRLKDDGFVERFIEGRELNVALLGGNSQVQVLPPAEIDFNDYPEGKPRIVGYAAKWQHGSFEHDHTPRRFDFATRDRGLLGKVAHMATACWSLFELRGYARVDFRVDEWRRPWILEVNANPCLSPDAGFAAALAQAGISFEDAVRRILQDALRFHS